VNADALRRVVIDGREDRGPAVHQGHGRRDFRR
jgi:hypothetical protein